MTITSPTSRRSSLLQKFLQKGFFWHTCWRAAKAPARLNIKRASFTNMLYLINGRYTWNTFIFVINTKLKRHCVRNLFKSSILKFFSKRSPHGNLLTCLLKSRSRLRALSFSIFCKVSSDQSTKLNDVKMTPLLLNCIVLAPLLRHKEKSWFTRYVMVPPHSKMCMWLKYRIKFGGGFENVWYENYI